MIKNPILFIIDNNGDYLRYGGTLRAINGYREFAFVISPRPLTDSVSMSIMTNNANYNRFEQYVLPTAIKVNELIEESDALYQTIADWNVFGVEIKPTALADISNFRSGATTFSFQFQTPHPSTKCVTYKGVFGVDNPLPTTGRVTGDYYECEDWNFYLTSGTQTYTFTKGMYVYFNGSRWIKDALLVELNTSTVSIPVEPSHAVGYEIDDDDANYLASIGAAAILAQQTAEQSAQDVEDLKDGTTPITFDKSGTDLLSTHVEEAIKEVNVKTNANKQNIEKIVDGTTIVKKAEQDKNGNDIVTTYETKSDATSKLSLKADKTYVDSQDQALDDKIDLLDERVEDLEIANMIKSYTYNPTTHVITFTYYDNTTTSFDLPLESAIVSASYDDTTQDITFVLQSGATLVVPLDDLVSGLASETWVTTYFIPKTAIVDNVTTDDATKVLSAKQGKVLQDTKEALANKAIDFSVVNATKYPSVQAVRNYVRDIGLGTPIVELNNHSLREVFKDTSLFYSKQLIQNPVFQLGTTGWDTLTETTFTVNDRIATIQTNDNNILRGVVQGLPNTAGKKIYYAIKYTSDNDVWFGDSSVQLTTGLATASYSHISDVMTPSSDVGFRISNKNATPTLINVDYVYSFNISSLQTDGQYSPLYQDTFDNLSENQAKLQIDEFISKKYLFIDYGTLGINTITNTQMDYWHTIYQSILLYGSLGHLYNYIKIVENEASSKYVEHDFSNKKIVCFGDSITAGTNTLDRFTTYMAQRLKATIYNVGFGGTRMSVHGATTYDKFCMYQLADAVVSGDFTLQDAQIGSLPEFATNLNLLKTINFEDVDYVTIFLGANDYASDVVIDNVLDEDDTETYAGATRYVLNKLLTEFPHLKIILITPTWRSRIAGGDGKDADNYPNTNGDYLYEFVDASMGVAKEFKLPSLDLFYGNFVNLYTHTIYLADGLHPNDEGAKLLSNRISQFLLNY